MKEFYVTNKDTGFTMTLEQYYESAFENLISNAVIEQEIEKEKSLLDEDEKLENKDIEKIILDTAEYWIDGDSDFYASDENGNDMTPEEAAGEHSSECSRLFNEYLGKVKNHFNI